MGLDVCAYAGLTRVIEDSEDDDGDLIYLCDHPDFPGRIGSIEAPGPYAAENRFHFRAGSYGGYGSWRDSLAQLAGYPLTADHTGRERYAAGAWAVTSGPFWELIDFSDCEGTIGPEVSAKLADDFAAHQEKADEIGGDFLTVYNAFRKAFELASDGGVVDFR